MPEINNVFNAFGAVLGVIGAQAVTKHAFERLLWPQRGFSHSTWRNLLALALLEPMGGPMYSATIAALDEFFDHGLLHGERRGVMLDTAFYRSEPYSRTAKDPTDASKTTTKPIRNFLWYRAVQQALRLMSPPVLVEARTADHTPVKNDRPEVPKRDSRALFTVSHLTLRTPKNDRSYLVVNEQQLSMSLSVFAGHFVGETSALVVTIIVASVWQSWWAFYWTVPLFLRLLSVLCQLRREPRSETEAVNDPEQDWQIDSDVSSSTLIVTGQPSIVLPFFTHYGHPKRDRVREVLLFAIVIALGCIYPAGLLCTGLWMPADIQYVWTAYQVYVVAAMYVAKYSRSHENATTESKLAAELSKTADDRQVVLGCGETAVAAVLEVTWHESVKEAREHSALLLDRLTSRTNERASEKACD